MAVHHDAGLGRKAEQWQSLEPANAMVPGSAVRESGFKSILDFVLAFLLLVLTAPVVVLAAIAVKLTSRGPVIYCQTRTGKAGVPYTIYKIRTMIHNCERTTGARWAVPGDQRVTWVGRFLRRTHIDELPQLWNILCGEMSLVGPRPERPEFVARFREIFPDYQGRLSVRPGVTGLAQVQLPPDTDLSSVARKLALDLYYTEHTTPWLDIRLILCTACTVVGIPFVVPRLLLQLPRVDAVEDVRQLAEDKGTLAPLVPASLTSG